MNSGDETEANKVAVEAGVTGAAHSTRSTADEVMVADDEGEGATNNGNGEPTAVGEMSTQGGGLIATTSSIASAADQAVAPQGEAVSTGDHMGGRATNVAAIAARSGDAITVDVEIMAARNPEEPSRGLFPVLLYFSLAFSMMEFFP
ncbi:hypothetical protein SEVIR_6G132200v4 [Setaria viridis]|uniref:Uncharacterized protein n=1 Tax=Setaria viridis TaxID=4556 RepID=A0A4U6U320_SETVI|nr:hypothetical protein SEVIR_6G132200v2 [Setaria viridis]